MSPAFYTTFTQTISIMTRTHIFCIAVFLVFTIGCGGNVPLSGKVTFSDDGSPLPQGTIAFLKDGKVARGHIKADGTFTVGFEKEVNGLPPGKYTVYIGSTQRLVGETAAGNSILEELIDKKYENPETSGLTVEVNASTGVYNIEVDRYTPSSGRR